ncbi:PspA-associated protein PspAB [Nocardioides marmotae]|uniref:Uncharacterized protein n=1 Tax=Nocardioides marmotae TaxID=2663857 RepID=A0A6I3JBK6_9ACTN|nr:hypothetical protein [Nocardioides marmotae]MCR6031866.1 hypothetical protein [Gordonia jinghuaiqii]MBC9732189.1 hypothetical protein [Nocardioides marmotae]MTB83310.1 hypothetical protein [Nocardioides marmotae]MTB95507.1 hypothetical protein [Nocardioides marmotae]QKE00938.1 hypothetical protein HPC71_07525 [Nocardioides marmotae]
MGFWQSVMGRSRPKQANLDSLFMVPSAAITLQTAIGLTPTGDGSVCYRAAAGAGFSETQGDVLELLRDAADAPQVDVSADSFGFTWLQVHRDPSDTGGLCTDLHAVNTTLEAEGFGPALLCSLVPFADASGRKVGLVYLYKQGTFYPFAPRPGAGQQRDNLLEIQVRDTLSAELPIEQDLSRWLAIWGAPGL